MFGKKNRKPLGLYIHIPFCKSKCDYCDFCSFVPNNKGVVEHYTDALILQMEDWSSRCRNYNIDSVYIGGGTPTYLDIRRVARIIDAIYNNFKVDKNAEFTIECNPATADYEYLRKLRRLGVNRLSIGCQSDSSSHICKLHHREQNKYFHHYLQKRMLVTRWQVTTLLWKSWIIFLKAQRGRGKRTSKR